MTFPSRSRIRFTALTALTLVAVCASAQRPSLRGNPEDGSRRKAQIAKKGEQSPAKTTDFGIASFSPKGPVTPGAVISVTFDADVTTSEALGTGETPESIFSFEPAIEGNLQWESLRHVRFVPSKPLKQATEYVARINPLLRSASGGQLKETTEFQFQTPPLSLRSATQYNFSDDQRVSIKLTFSDPVNPQELRKYLTLRSGDQDVRWHPENDVATAQPVVVTDPMSTDALRLVLEPGLKGTAGPLGITNRIEQKVRLDFRLVATQMKGGWENGKPVLRINFSSPPGTSDAAKKVKVGPSVKVSHFGTSDNTLIIYGEFEAEKRYTVTLDKGLRGSGEKMLLEPTTLSTWMPPMTPFLELPESGGGYLGTKSRMKLRVRTAAVNKLNVVARRVFDNNMIHQLGHSGWYGVASLGKKIAEKSFDLKPEPNKPLITEIDLKELLGADSAGIYGFEIKGETSLKDVGSTSDEGDYHYDNASELQDRTVINLSNLGIVGKKSPGEVMIFVAALDTAQPVADIKVSLYSAKHQLMGESVTDSMGMATIKDLPEADDDTEPEAVIAQTSASKEISILNLNDSLSHMEQFESSGRDYLRGGYEAYITPERGAYRPGETVHVSGFVRGRDATPPPGAFPVEMVLERPDGKKLTPEIMTPTASGLINFDLTVPAYAPTGYYNVEVRMPGTSDEEDNDEDY